MVVKAKKDEQISVMKVTTGKVEFCVLGETPIILNRLSEKTQRQLLLPPVRKNNAARASQLKHEPHEEYRSSPYKSADDNGPTRLLFPSAGFKKAMSSAALDTPGSQKAQIGRLTWVEGDYVNLYGIPELFMAPVRNSDIARTPDIRTRAIIPKWACRVSISYVMPILRETPVVHLLSNAGIMRGVGDGRQEKGTFNFGRFQLVDADNKEFLEIIKAGGREAQDKALAQPAAYDAETAELLTWFVAEAARRGFEVVA